MDDGMTQLSAPLSRLFTSSTGPSVCSNVKSMNIKNRKLFALIFDAKGTARRGTVRRSLLLRQERDRQRRRLLHGMPGYHSVLLLMESSFLFIDPLCLGE